LGATEREVGGQIKWKKNLDMGKADWMKNTMKSLADPYFIKSGKHSKVLKCVYLTLRSRQGDSKMAARGRKKKASLL
jgi:hypothetical protein